MKRLSPGARRVWPAPIVASLGLALCASAAIFATAQAAPTNVKMRDPSTLVKQGNTYWMYGTGFGVQQYSSTDRLNWTSRGPAFRTPPAWVAAAVPQNKDNGSWAPDVAFWDGQYHLYYSYSSLGSKRSAIGVATNATLDPNGWVDGGMVVQSGEETPYNCIDPGVFQDADGKWWLTFGSYFDGIYVTPLDARSGKRASNTAPSRIATRPGNPGNSIEASVATYHNGWYYLFVNWGSCLQGPRSTYNIRVGRARSPLGPYEDKTGHRMLEGGGSLFLGSVIDDETGKPFDDQTSPGHAGILHDGTSDYVSTHYEWSRFQNGSTTVNVNALTWDGDGWPRVVLDSGPYRVVSELPRHNILEAKGDAARGASAQTNAYEGKAHQRWTLTPLGDGYYTLGLAGGLVLGPIGGSSVPSTKLEVAPFQNADYQKWYARQNEDGTYTLLLKSSNNRLALDVTGASNNDEVPLQLWHDNYQNPQKWTFHLR